MTRVRLAVVLACAAAAAPLAAQQEERPKVPKDSVEVTVTGCLKGRVLSAADVRQTDVQSGPIVRQRAFRLAGKKDLMKEVKENDGQRVEIVGLIKKSALMESGMKFKGGRVAIGGGTMTAGNSGQAPDPAENVLVMDVSAVQALGGTCGSSD
jgi:hypothetical protein